MLKKAFKIAMPTSLAIGGYFGYQLQFGSYSSPGQIVEVRKTPKKLHYYELTSDFNHSEVEISHFVNEMMNENIQGTFIKLQLDEPTEVSNQIRFIIGIEESAENQQELSKQRNRFRTIETGEIQAVESNLQFEKRNYLLSAMQMTYIVAPALAAYVGGQKETNNFPGISATNSIKSITLSENRKIHYASISYPFGEQGIKMISDFKNNFNKRPLEQPHSAEQSQTQQQPQQTIEQKK